ncbi:MAG: cell division protein ZapA [Mailhella sp.]
MQSYHLTLCDLQVAFRTEASAQRVEKARRYVEERYSRVKAQGGQFARDKLLLMLLISMADDLLELQKKTAMTNSRMDELLQLLEEKTQAENEQE